ncbi:SRPBCC domain-containing protein [Cellulomonas sp. URHD0024]|uniref:SRPBCC family protein n=1 Tax=Cellulomonas sp. URHD0024 TaxID=1302620 RepID=UPI00041AB809|nr:SRPBCC domain-containing protein [Cellulomonas sp. URHD0024]
MTSNLILTFTVDETAERVFAAINDVRGWWSGPPAPTEPQIEGRTDVLGAEFTYTVTDLHYVRFRITELVPSTRVAWLAVESQLSFVQDRQEWDGTTVTFDIVERDGRTEVVFTHVGLVPEQECYDVCDDAWSSYVLGNLRRLIETGSKDPIDVVATLGARA